MPCLRGAEPELITLETDLLAQAVCQANVYVLHSGFKAVLCSFVLCEYTSSLGCNFRLLVVCFSGPYRHASFVNPEETQFGNKYGNNSGY